MAKRRKDGLEALSKWRTVIQNLPETVAAPTSEVEPVPMILHCPVCGTQHIDQPQPEKDWHNPPHRSHECQSCGHIWRPADVPTTGVESIKTKGQRDGAYTRPAPPSELVKAAEDAAYALEKLHEATGARGSTEKLLAEALRAELGKVKT
jgi:rubredoxin